MRFAILSVYLFIALNPIVFIAKYEKYSGNPIHKCAHGKLPNYRLPVLLV